MEGIITSFSQKLVITADEIDWWRDFGVYAVNRDTRIFENCSAVKGFVVERFYNTDENRVSDKLAEVIDKYGDYDYCLYNDIHELVGFAYRTE